MTSARPRRGGVCGTAAGLVVLLAACAPHGEGAPAVFESRAPLASCGRIELGQGESVPPDAWTCLRDRASTGAELAVTELTTEGDAIVTYYRVGPGIDGMQVFVDASADKFGGQVPWWSMTCSTVAQPDTCSQVTSRS